MILSPPTIRTQLGEAISVIADSDFWTRWETLIQVRSTRLGLDKSWPTKQSSYTGSRQSDLAYRLRSQ